jgi:hypothetical protein
MLTLAIEQRDGKIKEFDDHWLIVTWPRGERKYEVIKRRDKIEIDLHLYYDMEI